jgi:hypothetical protein
MRVKVANKPNKLQLRGLERLKVVKAAKVAQLLQKVLKVAKVAKVAQLLQKVLKVAKVAQLLQKGLE